MRRDVRSGPRTHAVGAICRALDGLPLATELAAARRNVLSVGDVHDDGDEDSHDDVVGPKCKDQLRTGQTSASSRPRSGCAAYMCRSIGTATGALGAGYVGAGE